MTPLIKTSRLLYKGVMTSLIDPTGLLTGSKEALRALGLTLRWGLGKRAHHRDLFTRE